MKIRIFNREICVCALLDTNSFMRKKQRRNGDYHEETDEAVFEKKSVRRFERGNDPDGIIHVCHHCVCSADGRGK